MRLLNKDTPFIWDDLEQHAFNNLKHSITHAPFFQPPSYTKYYSLYVVTSLSTIGMVLVHLDKHNIEHVIYYASKSLLEFKTRYAHVEKLALAIVIAVQKFYH